MLTFLRKIRKSLIESGSARKPASPVGKYILYAIGEIALVMIGILLALQVNNWNQERDLRAQEKKLVLALHKEMILNKQYLDEQLNKQFPRAQNTCRMYLEHTGLLGEPMSSDTFNYYLTHVSTPFFSPITAKFEQVINGEDFNLIQDDSLRLLLIDYKVRLQYANSLHEGARKSWDELNDYLGDHYSVRRTVSIANFLFKNLNDIGDTTFDFNIDDILKDPHFENVMTERLVNLEYWRRRSNQFLRHVELTLKYLEEKYLK
jgi:hypothetical protein